MNYIWTGESFSVHLVHKHTSIVSRSRDLKDIWPPPPANNAISFQNAICYNPQNWYLRTHRYVHKSIFARQVMHDPVYVISKFDVVQFWRVDATTPKHTTNNVIRTTSALPRDENFHSETDNLNLFQIYNLWLGGHDWHFPPIIIRAKRCGKKNEHSSRIINKGENRKAKVPRRQIADGPRLAFKIT